MTLQNTQKIQIELDGNPPFEYVVVKQGEQGSRIVEVTLLENKTEFEIPDGTTAKIKYYKPDGKKVLNPCTISGNVINVEYSEQMLAAAGTGRGEIVLYNGDSILRSATYYTKVAETVYQESGLISDHEFFDMAQSIAKADEAAEKALNAAKIAEAAAEGGGDSGGSEITVDDKISSTSTNPVQNKVIYTELLKKANNGDIPTIPESIKNPKKLKFTGASTQSYDGSEEVTVNIPSGGSDVNVDSTLSVQGDAADAKVTGDAIRAEREKITPIKELIDGIQKESNAGKQLVINSAGKIVAETPEESTEGDVINVDAELKQYMTNVKPAIKAAIINKGGEVEETDSFADYATRISEIPNGIYPAETIPEQTTLIAEGLQDTTGVKLSWTDVGAAGYLIVRKENIKPETAADGTIVYNGDYAEGGYTDTGAVKGKKYYYRIFCRNEKSQYQSVEAGAVAEINYIDRTGQSTVGDLELGDIIKFGQYGTSEYTWKIVDTLDKSKGYVTVAADQNPGNLQFDAPENASDNPNPITNRKTGGNNRWLHSNIRQFLNSDGLKNEWFTPQHEYDVKPSYASSDAFLKDFTEYEKNIIVSKTNKCRRDNNDGGGSETMIDKIWLPSSYAMSIDIVQPLEDDHVYEAFTDNESRSYPSNYWLRSTNGTTSGNSVRFVNSSGTAISSYANGSYAPRPFCLIPTSAYVAWSDSDNAYYFADDSQRNPES